MKKNNHWDSIFSNAEDSSLGWYEKDLTKTFTLLNKIERWEKSTVFVSGAGTSFLIDTLLSKKIALIVNDISIEAINKVKARLGTPEKKIDWLCQDISQPFHKKIATVDIWLDRAVLHFLIEEKKIEGYFENLKKHLAPNGYAIFAEFSKTGATKCAGLPIHQYDKEELSKRLGKTFKLISHFGHIYITPRGDKKPYIYTLYQRISNK
ncbi:SAM-dependent methyltransferases [hydrothermal vent metagenome]|uniref:SAM-dependent methyltransferases n=1 Tax=hydrothermal vent metagenome TaxID=652676 RepID=A0A1W1E033_9ZZZZ